VNARSVNGGFPTASPAVPIPPQPGYRNIIFPAAVLRVPQRSRPQARPRKKLAGEGQGAEKGKGRASWDTRPWSGLKRSRTWVLR